MKPRIDVVSELKLIDAARNMVRGGYSLALGNAMSAAIKKRLITNKIGEDGRRVRSGGVLTGRMWDGWRVKPTGKGTKAFFGGSSISSRWILKEKLGELTDEEIRKIQKGAPTPMVWLTKAAGVPLARIQDSSGKWIVRKTPDRAADAWERKGKKRPKPPKVRNRIKAASVQWGAGNSDFKNRSFLGPRKEEIDAALEFVSAYMEKNSAKGMTGFAHSYERAGQYSQLLMKELRSRTR